MAALIVAQCLADYLLMRRWVLRMAFCLGGLTLGCALIFLCVSGVCSVVLSHSSVSGTPLIRW